MICGYCGAEEGVRIYEERDPVTDTLLNYTPICEECAEGMDSRDVVLSLPVGCLK